MIIVWKDFEQFFYFLMGLVLIGLVLSHSKDTSALIKGIGSSVSAVVKTVGNPYGSN